MRWTALAIAAFPAAASAATCPAPESAPSVASIDAEKRLAFVERALDRAEHDSARWGHFWRAAFQTTAAVQFGLSLRARNDADRIDLIAGGIKSSVGFTFALVFQLPAERHSTPWADRPWREDGDVCTRLAVAESALERDARFEKRGRSLGMHALGFGFNLGVGVVTYFMHKRLWSVVLATITGSIAGTTRILTQPTVATEAFDAYRSGMSSTAPVSVIPIVTPQPGGAEFGIAITL
jgi:hypothetical protein